MHITAYTSMGFDSIFFVAGVVMIAFGSMMLSSGSVNNFTVGLVDGGSVFLIQSITAGAFTYFYMTLLPLNEAVERLQEEVDHYKELNTQLEGEVNQFNEENTRYINLNVDHEQQIQSLTARVAEQKGLLEQLHQQLAQFIDTNNKIANTAADMAATEESFQSIAEGLDKGINILKEWGFNLVQENEKRNKAQLQFTGTLEEMIHLADREKALLDRESALVDRMAASTAGLEEVKRDLEAVSQKRSAVGLAFILLRRISQKKIEGLLRYQQRAHNMLEYVKTNNPAAYQKAEKFLSSSTFNNN
jgi:chromosome segregation ATPase